MGVLAVALAAVNIFGGFLVTRRMLEMFRKKDRSRRSRTRRADGAQAMSLNLVTLLYLGRERLLHPGAQGPEPPDDLHPRQLFGMVGMGIAIFTTAALIIRIAGSVTGPGLGAAGAGRRRRLRRLARQDGRDDRRCPSWWPSSTA
jgi:hypothetical protein